MTLPQCASTVPAGSPTLALARIRSLPGAHALARPGCRQGVQRLTAAAPRLVEDTIDLGVLANMVATVGRDRTSRMLSMLAQELT